MDYVGIFSRCKNLMFRHDYLDYVFDSISLHHSDFSFFKSTTTLALPGDLFVLTQRLIVIFKRNVKYRITFPCLRIFYCNAIIQNRYGGYWNEPTTR